MLPERENLEDRKDDCSALREERKRKPGPDVSDMSDVVNCIILQCGRSRIGILLFTVCVK